MKIFVVSDIAMPPPIMGPLPNRDSIPTIQALLDSASESTAKFAASINETKKIFSSVSDIINFVNELTEENSQHTYLKYEKEILGLLQELKEAKLFEPAIRTTYQSPTLYSQERSKSAEELLFQGSYIEEHLNACPTANNRTITLSTATVCFADTHGRFDLLAELFKNSCDENGELPRHINFLGLGDYLGKSKDDGKGTLASLILLLLLALVCPAQIGLLVGNHEVCEVKGGWNWLCIFSAQNRTKAKKLFTEIFAQMPISARIAPVSKNDSGELVIQKETLALHGASYFVSKKPSVTRAKLMGVFDDVRTAENSVLWNQPDMRDAQKKAKDNIEGMVCRYQPVNITMGRYAGESTKSQLKQVGIDGVLCAHGHNNLSSSDRFFNRIFSAGNNATFGFIASDGSFSRIKKSELLELKRKLIPESVKYEDVIKTHSLNPATPQKVKSIPMIQEYAPPSPPSPVKRAISTLFNSGLFNSRTAKALKATEAAFRISPCP